MIQDVYNWFYGQLLAIEIPSGINIAANIAKPNEIFSSNGKAIWFEMALNTQSEVHWTETDRLYYAVMSIVTCVPQNTGTERVYNIAKKIHDYFGLNHFSTIALSSSVRVQFRNVEQMSAIVVNEVMKVNVRILVTLHERSHDEL